MNPFQHITDRYSNLCLDSKVVDIEILGEEITDRFNTKKERKKHTEACIDNLVSQVHRMQNGHDNALRSIRKGYTKDVQEYVGKVGDSAKGIADSINRLLQTMYKDGRTDRINLKQMKNNSGAAPKSDDGQSLFEKFCKVHDHRREATVGQVRNRKAHYEPNKIARECTQSKCGYSVLNEMDDMAPHTDARTWVKEEVENYIGLVHQVLKTIADKEERLSPEKKNRTIQKVKKHVSNFYENNKKQAITYAACGLLTVGMIGGAFIQKQLLNDVQRTKILMLEEALSGQKGLLDMMTYQAHGMTHAEYSKQPEEVQYQHILDAIQKYPNNADSLTKSLESHLPSSSSRVDKMQDLANGMVTKSKLLDIYN